VARAVNNLSAIRSRLGAYQNRLEHTIASLDVTDENLTGAYSRIMDTDMAEEMTEYTKDQVLSQAGTSMLAQANQRPSQVLQLLQ
jgi:flagellin